MLPRRYKLAVMAALLGAGQALAAGHESHPQEVETPGVAALTKCRNWLVMETCRAYDRIAIPKTVRPGDRFRVRFGSNPKSFEFRVGTIVHSGEACRLLGAVDWIEEIRLSGDKLDVSPCRVLR